MRRQERAILFSALDTSWTPALDLPLLFEAFDAVGVDGNRLHRRGIIVSETQKKWEQVSARATTRWGGERIADLGSETLPTSGLWGLESVWQPGAGPENILRKLCDTTPSGIYGQLTSNL